MTQTISKNGAGRPNAEEAERKHMALIEASLEEFATKGYNGASLRAIATRADISTRTLYNRYSDKAALFAACLDMTSKGVHRIKPDCSEGIESGLVNYIVQMQQQLSQERSRQISSLIFRESPDFEELRRIASDQFYRFQVAPVAFVLEQHGIEATKAQDYAEHFVAMALGRWQRRLLFLESEMDLAEMETHARVVTRIFLDGIPLANRKEAICP